MWLDLAESKLIQMALARWLLTPDHHGDEATTEAVRRLLAYFDEQVARVQKVSVEWERRKEGER